MQGQVDIQIRYYKFLGLDKAVFEKISTSKK
jgi:hypothetical protein